jgi:hypothetical protein
VESGAGKFTEFSGALIAQKGHGKISAMLIGYAIKAFAL